MASVIDRPGVEQTLLGSKNYMKNVIIEGTIRLNQLTISENWFKPILKVVSCLAYLALWSSMNFLFPKNIFILFRSSSPLSYSLPNTLYHWKVSFFKVKCIYVNFFLWIVNLTLKLAQSRFASSESKSSAWTTMAMETINKARTSFMINLREFSKYEQLA